MTRPLPLPVRVTGRPDLVTARVQELELDADLSGLETVAVPRRQLADGRIIVDVQYRRPVPRRWWHDWRAVAAVAVCLTVVSLSCAYALYRAVVALLVALPVLTVAGAVVLGLCLAFRSRGRTFTFTGRGRIE